VTESRISEERAWRLTFSDPPDLAVPQSFLVWRARLPQILLGQERVIVASQQELYELACTYAAQQRDFGNVEGQVVRALGDAYACSNLSKPIFDRCPPDTGRTLQP
jgi:hypothetical protein